MPPAARVGDLTAHPGIISGPGATSVLIEGKPAARAIRDMHTCSFPPPAVHAATPIAKGSTSVLIAGQPAARMGDSAGCGSAILKGAFTVLIGG
jgi:uncharacterized Zn-binding protein involved in type VI secretion